MDWKRWLGAVVAVGAGALVAPREGGAQPILGTCTTCSSATPNAACGQCLVSGTACFDTLPVAERRAGVFQTADGHEARSLGFGQLIRGASTSATDFNRAVSRSYNGNNIWLYYGSPETLGFCAPAGGPPPAFATDAAYHFGWDHRFEDTMNNLDCYNGEVDRFYIGAAPHADGERVCDGEQAMFLPQHGAIFDLGGEGNRVAVFPFTDHAPLPCESLEYSVWLSNSPDATLVAEPGHPDGARWNPAVLTRVFLQGWIPDVASTGQAVGAPLSPNLNNPTQRDGLVQVFALPCGLTFRYASIVAGNNGNPAPACTFWSFDAELDAVAGLNEDDTAICPDRDADGFRDRACGGNDCDDARADVNPAAIESCATLRDVNCDGIVTECPSNTTCINGLCAPQCVEGACPDGQTCIAGDGGTTLCLPTPCARTICPLGQVCGPTGCQDPCDGARCPVGQVCRGGACIDPCSGVLCPAHQHCGAGRCAPDCPCVACSSDLTCNASTGRCGAAGCDGLRCTPGSTLDCSGALARCIAPCEGVTCPLGSRCDADSGRCVADRCAGVSCPGGAVCQGGQCVRAPRMDAGPPDVSTADVRGTDAPSVDRPSRDAGAGLDAGIDASDGLLVDPHDPNCACAAPGRRPRGSDPSPLWLVGAGAVLVRRRRARRGGARRT